LLLYRVSEEFYDVVSDPDCLVNLIDDPALHGEVSRLRAELAAWMSATNDPVHEVFLARGDPAVRDRFLLAQEQIERDTRLSRRAVRDAQRPQQTAAPAAQ